MLSLSFDPPNRGIPSAGTSVPRSQEVCNISVTFQVSVGAQVQYEPSIRATLMIFKMTWAVSSQGKTGTSDSRTFPAPNPELDTVVNPLLWDRIGGTCCGQRTSPPTRCWRNGIPGKNCTKQALKPAD
ncbi:hypothetical protein M404DRAFT_867479 [Pisolithus tinctorius Marx 270]|uniref:Uncharacterized protein n=1 Tax=Pisolithus tinctorius Marx 270 TaxID=870435 RepID=A0A0C3N9Y4_PISTI|nr:hypothetical protein M404DRAFT_867479 [Pisolithus tinctorius Marx 270]